MAKIFTILMMSFILGTFVKGYDLKSTNNFIIKIRQDLSMKEVLNREPSLELEKEIIPNIGIFKKKDADSTDLPTFLEQLKERLKDKVEYIERVNVWYEKVNLVDPETIDLRHWYGEPHKEHSRSKSLVLQPPYYGMGIPEAWEQGYSGKGVVIGVTDVGINCDIPDLRGKIILDLSKSFVGHKEDFEPDRISIDPFRKVAINDHGNKCAGLIVGDKYNNECTVGVAHQARLAALKVFSISDFDVYFGTVVYDDKVIATAMVYELNRIHIFSNSWSTKIDFFEIPMFLKDNIKNSALKGRGGLGRINVFPPGGLADGFANNPYVVTVNGLGVRGQDEDFSPDCACVITTAFGQGHTYNSEKFITTSWQSDNCTDDFSGLSPAVAIVSGITALALEANPQLTLRDIKFLAMVSSSKAGIKDQEGFRKNAVGRYHHKKYGYGLLNAAKMVSHAKTFKGLPKLVEVVNNSQNFENRSVSDQEVTVALTITCPCNPTTRECIDTVEQVVIKADFTTSQENETELILVSPSNTHSYLMNFNQSHHIASQRQNAEFLSVHFWGEKAAGLWSLTLKKKTTTGKVSLTRFSTTLFGPFDSSTEYSKCATGSSTLIYCRIECVSLIALFNLFRWIPL